MRDKRIWDHLFGLLDALKRGELTKKEIERTRDWLRLCGEAASVELIMSQAGLNEAKAMGEIGAIDMRRLGTGSWSPGALPPAASEEADA